MLFQNSPNTLMLCRFDVKESACFYLFW